MKERCKEGYCSPQLNNLMNISKLWYHIYIIRVLIYFTYSIFIIGVAIKQLVRCHQHPSHVYSAVYKANIRYSVITIGNFLFLKKASAILQISLHLKCVWLDKLGLFSFQKRAKYSHQFPLSTISFGPIQFLLRRGDCSNQKLKEFIMAPYVSLPHEQYNQGIHNPRNPSLTASFQFFIGFHVRYFLVSPLSKQFILSLFFSRLIN